MVKARLQVVGGVQGAQKKKQREWLGKPGVAAAWSVMQVAGQKKMVGWVEKLKGWWWWVECP